MNIKEKSDWIEEYGDDCYIFHSGIGDVCLGYVAKEDNWVMWLRKTMEDIKHICTVVIRSLFLC